VGGEGRKVHHYIRKEKKLKEKKSEKKIKSPGRYGREKTCRENRGGERHRRRRGDPPRGQPKGWSKTEKGQFALTQEKKNRAMLTENKTGMERKGGP